MARARAILLGLGLVLMAAGGWALWRGGEAPPPAAEPAAPAAQSAARDEPQAAEAPRVPEIVPRANRDVTPPGVTPGPLVTGPLVRIPPPPRPAAEPPPLKLRLERLFRPVVDSAGSLTTAAGRLSLADIDAPGSQAACGEGAETWPCGLVARAELRRFIRGRAVECQVPPGAESLPETVRCSVAGSDIGEWLVRHGWARPAGDAYGEAAREAEAERRGLWGDRPR